MLSKLPYTKIFLNATVAFISYFTWTYLVNDIGVILSSFTQGCMSFLTTFFIASILEIIHLKTKTLMGTSFSVLALMISTIGLQTFTHYMIHTENIAITVLPSAAFGSLYSIGYIWHLKRDDIKSESLLQL